MKKVIIVFFTVNNLIPVLGYTQTAAQINQFNPASTSTIVVNMQEFESGLDDFSNYRGWKTNSTVLHHTATRPVRKPTDISFLVLHESASPDHGKGYNPPYTSHFTVLADGRILQFNDLAEIEWHEARFNNKGIGVEFVNLSWIRGVPAHETNLSAAQRQTYAESKGYLWAFWGEGYNIYRLPNLEQLEALYTLVRRLTRKLDNGFPSINNEWLQVVSYNEISSVWEFDQDDIPATDNQKAVKRYFIASSAYNYMQPDRFESFESGILSHACVNTIKSNGFVDEDAHPDGSFQSLFCWLRQRFDKEEAFEKAKDLMKNNVVVARTRANVKWMDTGVEKTGKRRIFLLDLNDL